MKQARKALVASWVGLVGISVLPSALAQTSSGSVMAPVCLPFAVVIALTITPVETLIDAFRAVLPGGDTNA